ncbi:hypothetical protein H8356DRAFT_1419170 [Neocallimastix lanati (nom. inval.)]|nr:hypothetical protein H8356DRAFT_1419170 [Neocallimastix sp. JGI-2020a]
MLLYNLLFINILCNRKHHINGLILLLVFMLRRCFDALKSGKSLLTKKERRLKILKHNNKLPEEIQNLYWENVHYAKSIESNSLNKNLSVFSGESLEETTLFILKMSKKYKSTSIIRSIKYKKIQFDFNFFFELAELNVNSNLIKLVSENYSICCSCCGESNCIPCFTQWILLFPKFEKFRNAVFVGFTGFLTNVMPIVIRDFYTIIILYAVRPTVVKNFDVWYISFNIK